MASSRSVAATLSRIPVFKALADQERLALARQMAVATFGTNQMIFGRGDPGTELYLVLKGRVRLSVFSPDGRTFSFQLAEPGDIFGEIAVLDGGLRVADATALSQAEVATITRTRLNALLDENTRLSRSFIKFLCSRLREISELAESVALHSIEMRLARFLLSALKRKRAGDSAAQITIELGITQTELALLIGASRQKVNSALHALENAGAIVRNRTRLTCNVAALTRFSER